MSPTTGADAPDCLLRMTARYRVEANGHLRRSLVVAAARTPFDKDGRRHIQVPLARAGGRGQDRRMVWTKWTKVETSLGLPERATAALADIRGFEPLAGRIVAGLGVEVGGLEVEFWHQLELRAGAPDRSLFYEFVVSHAIEDGLVYARLQSSGIELDHLPGQGRFPIWHDSPEVRSRKEGGYRPAGRDQVPDWDEKHAFLRRAMGPSIEAFLVGLRPIRAQA